MKELLKVFLLMAVGTAALFFTLQYDTKSDPATVLIFAWFATGLIGAAILLLQRYDVF